MVPPGVQGCPTGTTAPMGDGVDEAAADEDAITPLQKPLLQVLKAHC